MLRAFGAQLERHGGTVVLEGGYGLPDGAKISIKKST
jgi:hypothetical protein